MTDAIHTLANSILSEMRGQPSADAARQVMVRRRQEVATVKERAPERYLHMTAMIDGAYAAIMARKAETDARKAEHSKQCGQCRHKAPCAYAMSAQCGPAYQFEPMA